MQLGLVFLIADFCTLAISYSLGFSIAEHSRHLLDLQSGEYGLYDAPIERIFSFLAVSCGLVFWLSAIRGHHQRRMPFWETLRDLLVAISFAALCDAAVMYLQKLPFARLAWASTWICALALLPLMRRAVVATLSLKGTWYRPVILIGNGETAESAWRALESDPFLGYQVRHVNSIGRQGITDSLATLAMSRDIKVSVDPECIERTMAITPATRIVVALEPEKITEYSHEIQMLARLDPELIVVPPLRGLPLYGTEPMFFFSHEVLLLRLRNNLARWFPSRVKRIFDLILSIAGLVAITPFFVWMVLRIRADGGPAIFGHLRVGRNGREFKCYKFRTMVVDSEQVLKKLLDSDSNANQEWNRDFKLKNDPRITPVGVFLRKTSLDELPQLFNVIKGDMSLVGPRPIIQDEVIRYGDSARFYFDARPGITGLWQISGRNDVDYSRRVALDTWYVQNWSIWHDIIILFKTIPVVVRRDGAY